MSIFSKFFSKSNGSNNQRLLEMAVRNNRKKNDLLEKIIQQTNYRAKQDIQRWRLALQQAENWDQPSRYNLINLYNEIILDNHLFGIIENQRKLRVMAFDFRIVNKAGDTDEVLTDFFQQQWFRDFQGLVLDSDYWGHSLMQVQMKNNKPVIELIPRRHVEPHRGYILKWQHDYTGLPYRDGYEDTLIEAGKPLDLGLLNKAAPLVLFKKNAMSAWSEYGDVFGMPMRIGKTNSNRKEDVDRMEEALESMGKAAYAVFGMGEEISFVESNKTAGETVYDKMMERINSELSKLILGSTMTADVGASGSRAQAEVHENAASDVVEADKLRLKYIINDRLIPVLRAQGVTGLDDKLFAWEESKDLKTLFDWTSKSLEHYKIEPKWITDTFGIPVEEKPAPEPTKDTDPFDNWDDDTDPEPPEPEKKKLELSLHKNLRSFYIGVSMTTDDDLVLNYRQWMGGMRQFMDDLGQKRISPEQLNEKSVLHQVEQYAKGLKLPNGESFIEPKFDAPDYAFRHKIRENLFMFAGAKTYNTLRDMNDLLVKKDGSLVSFAEFQRNINTYRNDVLKINERYNSQYLKAEYNTAKAMAYSARRWASFQDNRDILPNLKYRAVDDKVTRATHKALDGYIRHIDDPIWNTLAPPNDWQCRCWLEATNESETLGERTLAIPKAFQFNPGKQETFFSPDHPYYKKAAADGKLKQVMSRSAEIALQAHVKQNRDIYERFDDEQYTKVRFDDKTGGFEIAHKEAQKLKPHERKMTDSLIAEGYRVLRPQQVEGDFKFSFDAYINDVAFEMKQFKSRKQIASEIKRKLYQARSFYIEVDSNFTKPEINKLAVELFNANKLEVLLIKKMDSGRIYRFDRKVLNQKE